MPDLIPAAAKKKMEGACKKVAKKVGKAVKPIDDKGKVEKAINEKCKKEIKSIDKTVVKFFAEQLKIHRVGVLENRKTGADGKAEDCGINRKADAIATNQQDNDRALEEFLDKGRHVARQCDEAEIKIVTDRNVERIAQYTCDAAQYDRAENPAHRDELVAVEKDERCEKAADR